MSSQTKPSIVFAHGLWADGSCFSKLISPLQAEGYEVITSQHGLDTHQATSTASSAPFGGSRALPSSSATPTVEASSPLREPTTESWGSRTSQHSPQTRTKPSAYVVATDDRTVHPELERFVANRMGATTYEVESSHVPMLSNPGVVIDAIRTLANSLQGALVG